MYISVYSVMPVLEVLWLVFFELGALMCMVLHVFVCVSPLSALGRLEVAKRHPHLAKKGSLAIVPMYSVPR